MIFDSLLLAVDDSGDLLFDLLEVRRCLHPFDAESCTSFVDEVDGLVRKMSIGDVAVGEVGRSDERLVGDGDPVVSLVAIAETFQDLDRVGDSGLFDLDRLEATFESCILLEVLAILVERGCTNGLEFTAGKHRLQDRGRVDRTLGSACTNERVEFVDEQDDVAAGLDLLQHFLQALLEVPAVSGTCNERAKIERVEMLALERGQGHRLL